MCIIRVEMRVINTLKCLEMVCFLKTFQRVKTRINSRGGELTLKAPLELTLKPPFFSITEKRLLKFNWKDHWNLTQVITILLLVFAHDFSSFISMCYTQNNVTSVMDSGEVQEANFVWKMCISIYCFFFPFHISLFHLSKKLRMACWFRGTKHNECLSCYVKIVGSPTYASLVILSALLHLFFFIRLNKMSQLAFEWLKILKACSSYSNSN